MQHSPDPQAVRILGSDIREGDYILNVGKVLNLRPEGVFILTEVERFTPSIVTGRIEPRHGNVTFHEIDEVWILR